jgi:hypothetical protein
VAITVEFAAWSDPTPADGVATRGRTEPRRFQVIDPEDDGMESLHPDREELVTKSGTLRKPALLGEQRRPLHLPVSVDKEQGNTILARQGELQASYPNDIAIPAF